VTAEGVSGPIEQCRIRFAVCIAGQQASDQAVHPVSHIRPHRGFGHRGAPEVCEHPVGRFVQVRQRIDQRAVQIERYRSNSRSGISKKTLKETLTAEDAETQRNSKHEENELG